MRCTYAKHQSRTVNCFPHQRSTPAHTPSRVCLGSLVQTVNKKTTSGALLGVKSLEIVPRTTSRPVTDGEGGLLGDRTLIREN